MANKTRPSYFRDATLHFTLSVEFKFDIQWCKVGSNSFLLITTSCRKESRVASGLDLRANRAVSWWLSHVLMNYFDANICFICFRSRRRCFW